MYSEIDIEKWPRKATYEFFKDYEDPFFNIAANLDVTPLYKFCRNNRLKFSLAIVYFALKAANEIAEFRYRLLDGKPVVFDLIHATQTILNEDETFSFSYYEVNGDIFEFDRAGREAVEKYKALKTYDVEIDRLDLIYFSVIPWVSFTSFKHAGRLDKTQSVPRMVFGKLFDSGSQKLMPLSVEVNHTLVDGLHVGKFFNGFQRLIDEL